MHGAGSVSDSGRLLAEAQRLAKEQPESEIARFNAERAKLLRGKPLAPGERLPVDYTFVGGDLPE